MNVLGWVLTAVLALDGGVDGGDPSVDLASKGIHFVTEARTCAQIDGGFCTSVVTLGEGWWLSRDRVLIIGRRITALENENAVMKAELADIPWVRAALIGLGTGVVVGVVGTLYLETKLK